MNKNWEGCFCDLPAGAHKTICYERRINFLGNVLERVAEFFDAPEMMRGHLVIPAKLAQDVLVAIQKKGDES